MSADTRTRRFSERTIKQVRLDGNRAMARRRFCPDRSDVVQLRCMDDCAETETSFGRQLWYFEGLGVDEHDLRHSVYGVVEYSLQFGLYELVQDQVFDSQHERERYRQLYERQVHRPTWGHPAHRWLLAGVIAVASVFLAYLFARFFPA